MLERSLANFRLFSSVGHLVVVYVMHFVSYYYCYTVLP
jgi:hypothetical protein